MTDSRNWSTKTLAKQLVRYLTEHLEEFDGESTIKDLLHALSDSIVAEEVGVSLDVLGE